MSPVKRRFTPSEKGKGISTEASPPKDAPLGPKLMESAMRAHRGTTHDTTELSAGRTRLAPDEGVQFREDDDGHCPADEGDEGAPADDRGVPVVVVRNAEERVERPEVVEEEIRRLVPFCYNRDRTVEQLPDLLPESSRRATSVSSPLKGLRVYGVTLIIPRADQRPWSPPIGYHCVYESFIGEDSKLWLPIPRLITSYCSRRNIAISQLMSGAVRIAVGLMVMAAKIDLSMSVRVFKEITQTQPKLNGLFAVQTRSGLHILTGHPMKTRCWQRHYFYIKAEGTAFEEPPSDRYRFLWNPHIDVPCPASKGKRLRLPAMGKILKEYPNYSEILGARLGGEGLHSAGEAEKESNEIPRESDEAIGTTSGGAESAEPWKKKVKSARRKDRHVKRPRLSPERAQRPTAEDGEGEGRSPVMHREDLDGDRSPGSVPDGIDDNQVLSAQASPMGEQGASAGPKRKRTPKEGAQEPDEIRGDSVDRLVPPRCALWDGQTSPTKKPPIATSEAVHFHYNKDYPFVNDLDACGELIRQIRGGVRKMPEVSELVFANKFLDSARADIVVRFCPFVFKNLLVLEYELALRKVVAELVKAEETIRTKDDEFEKTKKEILEKAKRVVAERNRHYRDCKRATKKVEGLEADLEAARATISQLEREKAKEADMARREMDRLRRSGFYEVTCERNRVMTGMTLKCNRRFEKFQKYMADRDRQESKLFLHSQASGMLQSLNLLEKWGLQVPQKLKDILVEDEAKFRKEAEDAEVEEIGDQDLSLSTLCVEPLFGFDRFGSNMGAVDPTTAASLRSPAPGDIAVDPTLDPAQVAGVQSGGRGSEDEVRKAIPPSLEAQDPPSEPA
ncbi:hypothetical protein N665_1351s0001 [Sinapis alba]|nr:hypothetical protein N665_1351s0001 [Sinapis alba]